MSGDEVHLLRRLDGPIVEGAGGTSFSPYGVVPGQEVVREFRRFRETAAHTPQLCTITI